MKLIGILWVLISTASYAGTIGPALPHEAIYLGVFGGAGTSTRIDISQYGTAFYTEANGGPLAVDAFGRTNRRSLGFLGAHVGYQWSETFLAFFPAQSGLTPAAELEGYYLGSSTFTGHDINNNTARLPEHDFVVTYPLRAGIFLVNALANFNSPSFSMIHPYIGAGIGAGVLSISNASATQVAPPEPGINHYNANTSDKDATFAAQAKAGFNAELCTNIAVFVEYRMLYLASSSYAFGSTVYPGHPVTSNWLVKLDSQFYNMGAIGIHYLF